MAICLNGDAKKIIPVNVYATWLWDSWDIERDEAGVLAFLKSKDVKKLYIQIDREVPTSVYQRFIEKAALQGVQTFALDGAPDWVAANGRASQDQLMDWLQTYQESAGSQQQFAGIHLDVEPYLYNGWAADQKAAVFSYQKLLVDAKATADTLALPLEVDVPFWFDEIIYENAFGSGVLVEWVITNTDGITIMAYRDKAPLIISLVENEINYAAKHGKKAVVGVETAQTDEGKSLTFFGEGEGDMHEQLAEVHGHYKDVTGYGGIAIHHLASWKAMGR